MNHLGGRPACDEFPAQTKREENKTMRSNNVIILIVAVAMGGGAAYLARSWLQGQLNASAYQPASHIVVAAEPLAYGEAVTADNVSEIPWYTKTLPDGAFATKDDLLYGGPRTAVYPFERGGTLLRPKVSRPV